MFREDTIRNDTPMSNIPSDYDTFLRSQQQREATPGFRRSWSPESDALPPDDWTSSYTHHTTPLRSSSTHPELPTLSSSSTFGLQAGVGATSSGYNSSMLFQRVRELEMRNTSLAQQVYKLQGELKGSRTAYDSLLARIPTDGVFMASSGNIDTSPAASLSTPTKAALLAVCNHPPIVTLNRMDYQLVRFWYRSDFTNWVSEKTKASPLREQEGSLQYRFLESEDGECIREQKKKLMLETLYAAWHSLLHAGLLPDTWGRASLEVRMYVWATMEAAFVELRFCDGHWKTQLLATLNYPWWSSKHLRRIAIGGDEEGGGGDDKKAVGAGRRSLKIARKRAAPDTTEDTEEENVRKPKKVKSVFSKTASPSPAVTSSVTSTAAIDAPPLLHTTSNSRETPPSAPPTPTADGNAASNGLAKPPAPSLQEQESDNLIAPDAQASAFDTGARHGQDSQGELEMAQRTSPAANARAISPAVPPAASFAHGPSSIHDPSSIREASAARNPAAFSQTAGTSIEDDFVYPSVPTPAASKQSPLVTGTGPATTPPQVAPASLDSVQRSSPQRESVTPSAPSSTSISDGVQASAASTDGPTGKKITAYMLCRQNFERAHPGVGKKDMTKLFKEYYKQMASNERKEWNEKAKRANGSQIQAAQATAVHR